MRTKAIPFFVFWVLAHLCFLSISTILTPCDYSTHRATEEMVLFGFEAKCYYSWETNKQNKTKKNREWWDKKALFTETKCTSCIHPRLSQEQALFHFGWVGGGSVLLSSHYVRAADENSHVQLLPGTRGLDLGFLHLDPTWMYWFPFEIWEV